MTRARALKQTIRARAAKTGERYTTARRHVLKELAAPGRTAPMPAPAHTTPSSPANLTKGAVSDIRVRDKTGHGLDHWFDVLDRFGAVEKGHSAAARHLNADHAVDGWYAQGITVAYERARGVRTINQRVSGEYEVSVSKTVNGQPPAIAQAFTHARRRAVWLAEADPALAMAIASALKGTSSKGFVIRPDGLGRFRYKWGTTTVQVYLVPKPKGNTSVVVTQMKLASAADLETRRRQWRNALADLARLFMPD